MGGFSRRIGCSNSFIAELWALRDGLILCHDMHLTTVEIHLDASAVVQLFSNPSNTNMSAMPFIDDCRQLLSQIAHIRVARCFREANFCAYFLARVGTKQDRNFICIMIRLWILGSC